MTRCSRDSRLNRWLGSDIQGLIVNETEAHELGLYSMGCPMWCLRKERHPKAMSFTDGRLSLLLLPGVYS